MKKAFDENAKCQTLRLVPNKSKICLLSEIRHTPKVGKSSCVSVQISGRKVLPSNSTSRAQEMDPTRRNKSRRRLSGGRAAWQQSNTKALKTKTLEGEDRPKSASQSH